MTTSPPPANVQDLLAKVKQSTANIQRHRDVMAQVAAEAAAKATQPPAGEVKQQ